MRFETVPDELVDAIALIEDEAILTNLLRQGITIENLEAFQALINYQ